MKDIIYNYMEDYLNFCKSDKSRSRRTLKVYRISISKYIDLLNFDENFPLDNIFIASFKSYYDYLFNKGYALSTLKVKMKSIRLFLIYLESKGIISDISNLFILDNMRNSYNSEKIEFLEEKANVNKMEYTNLLNSISESDIKALIMKNFDFSNEFKYGSKKHQKFSRNVVILILSYYLSLGCDKICDLKSKDVVILDTSIVISVMSLQGIVHKLYIYDAFYISIIKKYFEITESLITEIGYFIVNIQSKNKMTEPTLNRVFRDYKFDNGSIPVKITSKFIRDLRLLHLLKNNENVYYIQQLFDYDIDTLLERVRYFEIYCGLSCNFSTSINIVT